MIIELVGLPGSGKTTLERRLRKELKERGYQILDQTTWEEQFVKEKFASPAFKILFYITLWLKFITQLFAAREGLAALAHGRRVTKYWALKDLALSTYFLDHLKAKNDKQKLIYFPEEGLVQHLASLQAWGGTTTQLLKETTDLNLFKQLTLLHIQIPPAEGFKRLWSRGVPTSWPKTCTSKEQAHAVYANFDQALNQTLKAFKQANTHIIDFDNQGRQTEIDQGIPQLIEELLAYFSFEKELSIKKT
ncbi:ATP-binding protein [Oligoflexia bacterium]|nr:ATP-binding protein [Oligoflexia bacterium]